MKDLMVDYKIKNFPLCVARNHGDPFSGSIRTPRLPHQSTARVYTAEQTLWSRTKIAALVRAPHTWSTNCQRNQAKCSADGCCRCALTPTILESVVESKSIILQSDTCAVSSTR